MKANELMIGSYIFVGKCHSNMDGDYDVFFNARPITIEDFKFWADNDWDKNDFNEFLAPIPLTPEILEKNGFDKDAWNTWISADHRITLHNEDEYLNTFNKWHVHIDTEDMRTIGNIELTYVHQFQQFLRLCGLDDMANNFKV